MTERLSIALRNKLLGKECMRGIFRDCVMKIYSGAAPATADEAVTGVLLAAISLSGGAVSADEFAIPSRWKVVIPGTHVAGTYGVIITVEAATYTCTYDANADHASNDAIAVGLARAINNSAAPVFAIAAGDTGTPVSSDIFIQPKVGGIHMGIVDGGGTVTITTFTELLPAHAACDAVSFAHPSAGAMSKNASVWSDTVLVSGVAGYFRIVTTHDDGTDDTTTLDQPRAQGTVSTSGAELNMANTSLVVGEVHTVDSYSISLPAE